MTAVAGMQLLEQGKFILNTLLYDFIPEFKEMYIDDGNGNLKKAENPITMRHIFTMTSGMTYIFPDKLYNEAKTKTNGQFISRDGDFGLFRFKGTATKDDGIKVFPFIRVMSSVSGLNVAKYMGEPLEGEEFDIELKVPYGSDYHIIIEFIRENDEEWVSYRNIISKIAIGDAFIIAGKSNAVGYGCGCHTNTIDSRIYNLKMSENWDYASHPLHSLDGYAGEVKRDINSAYSQHITMAKKVIAHTGVPIAFIPTAVGGTSIYRWNKRYIGNLYDDMIRRVKISGVKTCRAYLESGLF